MPVRVPRALLVLALGLTVGLVAVLVASRPISPASLPADASSEPSSGSSAGPAVGGSASGTEQRALAVLHAWDVRRAAAWAAGDPDALAGLYVEGSSAAAADVALLRRYAARGLLVRDLRMQLLRARVLTARPRLVQLEVVDRLSRAVAVRATDPSAVRRLPAGGATKRLLTLRLVGGQWRMAQVSAVVDR